MELTLENYKQVKLGSLLYNVSGGATPKVISYTVMEIETSRIFKQGDYFCYWGIESRRDLSEYCENTRVLLFEVPSQGDKKTLDVRTRPSVSLFFTEEAAFSTLCEALAFARIKYKSELDLIKKQKQDRITKAITLLKENGITVILPKNEKHKTNL